MKTLLRSLALLVACATSAAAAPTYVTESAPVTVNDIAAATLTATTTSSTVTAAGGLSYTVQLSVGAVSGTSPTLDVEVQQSDDGGTNWVPVYDFARISATGVYRSAPLPLTSGRLRYVETVGGTSPSFAISVKREMSNLGNLRLIRQLYDRTVTLTTGSSTTAALYCEGAMNAELSINIGTAGTAPALQLQGTDDGTTWYSLGSPLTATASSTVASFNSNIAPRFLRAVVTTAGATVVPGYVLIKAY